MAHYSPDFSDVRGMSADLLTAIECAASTYVAGGDLARVVLLLTGAPGCGKTMIARRVPSILPALDQRAAAWLAAEYEGIGLDLVPAMTRNPERPFRAPHHTISTAALVGEGSHHSRAAGNPCGMCAAAESRGRKLDRFHPYHTLPRAVVGRAGEIDLARFGVLMLDELPEFRIGALEDLGRAWQRMSAGRPLLVATANACPCGWAGSAVRQCTCPPSAVARHAERVSKALTAIAGGGATVITAEVPMISVADMRGGETWPASAEIAARVAKAVSL